jgi:hypothetical protein
MDYTPKTDEEVKQLALDIYKNKIFIATMIKPNQLREMIPMVFMPLMFMETKVFNELKDMGAIPYEYYDEAMPRSINGFPCFMSMNILSGDDYHRVLAKLNEIREATEKL